MPFLQPPPRGCVLKLFDGWFELGFVWAAASARLCVETIIFLISSGLDKCSRLRAAVC